MPAPSRPRTAHALRVAATALLSASLIAGLALSASGSDNPLVPETTTPEPHPVGPAVGEKLARLERAAPVTTAKPITSKSFTGFAFPACTTAGGSATLLAAIHSSKSRTLRWVVSNDGAVSKTGLVKVKGRKSAAKATEFSVSGLPAGAYRLDFRKSGSSKVSVRVPVLVLECARATATCRGVAFTNPAGNPAVQLDYGPADEADVGDGGFFTLGPGQTRAVRTDSPVVVWSAYGMSRRTQSSAGAALSVTVPQDCTPAAPVPGDNSLVSYGLAGCLEKGTGGARLELGFDRLKDIAVRFEVRNAADAVVLHGDAGAQVEAVGYLPASGPYRYRTYLNGSATAYEDVPFTVLDCVSVKRTCSTVTFSNPNPVRLVIDYATRTGKHSRTMALPGEAAKKVRWKYANLSWSAYPAGAPDEVDGPGPHLVSAAGDLDQPRPTHC